MSARDFLAVMVTFALPLAAQRGGSANQGLPMTAARQMQFTASEGTWISLDVSPDGATIVFDLLGRLYTMPSAGGTARAITNGFAYDQEPRFSPDGRHIAFVSDRSGEDNLWIANPDGSNARAMTTDENALFTSPSWSADSRAIFISKKKPHFFSSAYEVWRYEIDGGSGTAIVKSRANPSQNPNRAALGAVLAPDQRHLYYARKTTGGGGGGRLTPWQIVRRDLASGEDDVLTAIEGGAFRPLLSPDGRVMIYGTRFQAKTALRLRDLTTGEERWLKYPIQRDDQESATSGDVLPGYAFFPDGKDIAYFTGGKIHRLNLATGDDRVIEFQAEVSRELGPKLNFQTRVEQGPVRARIIQGTALSPDGKTAAFSALTHVYVSPAEGGSPRRLVPGEGTQYEPVWSPDGEWIAYVSWDDRDGAIWKIKADGSGSAQRLTKVPAHFQYLAWSKDGARLAAVRTGLHQALSQENEWGHELATSELMWIPATGGDPHVVLIGDELRYVHFTNDPDRIFLTITHIPTFLAANSDLISVRWDGTDRRTYLKVRGRDVWGADYSPIVDIQTSPDQRQALIVYHNELYLSSLPMPDGEVPIVNVSAPANSVARLTRYGADEAVWADRGNLIAWTLGSSLFTLPASDVAGDGSGERRYTHAFATRLHPKEREFDIEVPRHTPQGTIVLRGARVITMHGDEVLPSADIVVRDNRIVSVAPTGGATPNGARVIDVTGRTIVPGFVDMHAHWFEIRRGVLDRQNWDFLANLAYGITTGRDPQTGTNDTFAYQDMVDAGQMLGPRAYSTGPGIFYVADLQTLDEAVDAVTRYKKYYRTNMLKAYMSGGRRQRELIAEACRRLEVMPTTEGAGDLALDLTHFIDGFSNEHQLPINPVYGDVAKLIGESGGYYTPTYIIGGYGGPGTENLFYETTGVFKNPKVARFIPYDVIASKATRIPWFSPDEYSFPLAAEGNARIIQDGGKICVGGHGQFQGLSFHWEMWSLRQGSVSAMDVLRSATINGAEAIGLAQDLGSIEAGKLADLVILRKNPLDDIRNTADVESVMKNGELFDAGTLNEVWPEKRALPPLWFWTDRPDAR